MGGAGSRTERIKSKVVSFQVSLEQRAHLSITRTRVVQDDEMDLETNQVDDSRKRD